MTARLLRFYPGTDPMMWLQRTPSVIVRACLRMLPQLEAEESVLAVNRIALGGGTMPTAQAEALSREWSQAAAGARATPPKASPEPLRALGFAVRRVPKRTPAP